MNSLSDKITELRKLRKLQVQELADKVGISHQGLHGALKTNSFKVEILQKIAEALSVDITYFFKEDGLNNSSESFTMLNNEIEYLRKEVDMQKERLKDKEGQILLLEQLLTVQKQLNEDMRKQMVNAIKKKPE